MLLETVEQRVLYANPACASMWNRTADELLRQPRRWLEAIHECDRPRIWRHLRRAPLQNFREEIRIVREDGSTRRTQIRGVAIHDTAGTPCRLALIARDVEALRRVEEETAQLKTRLLHGQQLQTLGLQVSGIAHDVNSILALVEGYATLCAEHLPPGHPAHEWLDTISDSARHGVGLVRQVLAASRPEQGAPRGPNPLRPTVEAALKLLRPMLSSGVRIRTDFGDDLPEIAMNPGKIHQLIANLCINAAHAIGRSSGQIEVRANHVVLTVQDTARIAADLHPGSYLRLSVTDTGCGMDEATAARIFEPFFTTKAPSEGTGLGLHLVREIVSEHGGAITVSTCRGEGTTFVIHLPAVERPAVVPVFTGLHEGECLHAN
ncbi:MAG: ATP-binding protein [Gammaproteobacteria bacterium]